MSAFDANKTEISHLHQYSDPLQEQMPPISLDCCGDILHLGFHLWKTELIGHLERCMPFQMNASQLCILYRSSAVPFDLMGFKTRLLEGTNMGKSTKRFAALQNPKSTAAAKLLKWKEFGTSETSKN